MDFAETLRIALGSLLQNRTRAFLTMLGIIIGVSAVISLVNLGNGVQNYVTGQFAGLGSDLVSVSSVRPSPNRRNTILPLTTAEAQDLLDPQIAPSIKTVAPIYALAGIVTSGSESVSSTVLGVTANYNQLLNWAVRDGAFVSTRSLKDAARVAVLGSGVVEKLFGDKTYNPLGHRIRINNREFTIIGVMQDRAVGTGTDENQLTFVPLTTAQSRLDQARTHDGTYKVSVLYVQVISKDRTESAVKEITAYLNSAHKTPPGGDIDFVVTNQANLLKTVTQILDVLTVFLSIIASISLLVGGIGIMNIMLVSVTERTREIGLRKAIGARGGDLLGQFLFESLLLSLVGGLGGIAFGWLITLLIGALVPDLPIAMTWSAVLLATGVSALIGMFFGLFPASRAARMRPIDALRYE
jgi:putative ABC transport system permease protein